jgi:hypothetical protein
MFESYTKVRHAIDWSVHQSLTMLEGFRLGDSSNLKAGTKCQDCRIY